MFEPLLNIVVPTLVILGIIVMAVGFILWKYVSERIVHIMGLILLVVGFIFLLVGLLGFV